MFRGWRFGRRRPDEPRDELAEIFPADADPEGLLLQTARRVRETLRSAAPPEPDPTYGYHLRASLMAEAHSRRGPRASRQRRLGSLFGVGLGLAGLAMIGVVLLSVLVLPQGARRVVVQASVQGNPRVAVTQAIDLSFNQPMMESSVVAGLKIEPAVAYEARWKGSQTLSILPRHNLVPNVAYEVTIAKAAARAQNGATPLSNIVIPFGTAPLSSTTGGSPPSLVAVSQVANVQGAQGLQYAPDGELLVLASGAVSGTTGASAPGSPASGGGAVYALTNPETTLAVNASGPVVSPDSQSLAYWSPSGNGALTLMVTQIGGNGQPQVVASSTVPEPQAAWVTDSTLLYPEPNGLFKANLDGQVTPAYPFVKLGSAGFFEVAPGGAALFAEPGGVPTIYNLQTGASSTVAGMQGLPVFSPNGSQVAYVQSQGGRESIVVANGLGGQPRALVVAAPGLQISQLAFSPGGQYIAYIADTPGVGAQLGALAIATGTSDLISSLTGMSMPAWSPEGTAISVLQTAAAGTYEVLTLQLSSPPQLASATADASGQALVTASNVAQLQVSGGSAALTAIQGLLAPGVSIPAATLLPGRFDRFYAISSTPSAAGSSSFQVALELLRDPIASTPAEYLQETATVSVSGSSGVLTALTLGSPTTLPQGPMVISASSTSSGAGSTTFVLQFDADLDPSTVGAQAVELTSGGQSVSGLQVSYQAASRQMVISATGLGTGPLVLTIGPPLADVDHTLISVPYQLSLPAPPEPPPASG